MLNHIDVMGRLTRHPQLRHTQGGKAVASFTLAVDRDFSGERKETDFIDIVAWGKTGELASNYLDKGSLAAVSGRLQIRDWTDKDGNKRKSAEVVAERVYFGDTRRPERDEPDYVPSQADYTELEDDDDELPF